MATLREQVGAQITSVDAVVPRKLLLRLRARLRSRFHQFILDEFTRQAERLGMTRARLARRIRRRPEQVTRWLGTPSNMELDSISDLMFGLGLEPDFEGVEIATYPLDPDLGAAEAQPEQANLPPFKMPSKEQGASDIGSVELEQLIAGERRPPKQFGEIIKQSLERDPQVSALLH